MLSFFSKSFLGETEIDSQINSCIDRKSTRLNSSHSQISYAVFCLKKKKVRIKVNDKIRGYVVAGKFYSTHRYRTLTSRNTFRTASLMLLEAALYRSHIVDYISAF